ncbi:MAG: AmmeMemoRadiSam system protein B [Gammaproteobacteria bacterium]|nr:AmmeMemoRadiSam system protein B [Gammaproteobacteria bacterium]MDH5692142.1 AmmeMemoRadiSam system protein B [Gammaproteobacteria bacterium]
MMAGIRRAAVAELFYPGRPTELAHVLDELLSSSKPVLNIPPKAIVAPHAGYIYSGACAAAIYGQFQKVRDKIKRVVLLGPAHRVPLSGLAMSSADFFETPLGQVPVDKESYALISDLDFVGLNDYAHRDEHSLEVHIPFLQCIFSSFSIVPLVVGSAPPQQIATVLERLWGGPETLCVVSSDLSHFHAYEEAKKLDSETTHAIESLDYLSLNYENACGRDPLSGLLLIAQHKGLSVTTISQCNSGDTAGDRSRVVGYGAYAFN